jgi:beta-lactamase regulating signal transducer with metallopeptidase domain
MENNLIINEENKIHMITTSKWGKFLGILGYLAVGLMILLSVFMILGGFFAGELLGRVMPFPFPLWIIGVVYLIIAILYFLPVHKMYKMCSGLRTAADSNDQASLNSAFSNMAQCYKYTGIMAITLIVIYILFIIGIMLFAGSKANELQNMQTMEELDIPTDSTEMDYAIDTAAAE